MGLDTYVLATHIELLQTAQKKIINFKICFKHNKAWLHMQKDLGCFIYTRNMKDR